MIMLFIFGVNVMAINHKLVEATPKIILIILIITKRGAAGGSVYPVDYLSRNITNKIILNFDEKIQLKNIHSLNISGCSDPRAQNLSIRIEENY